MCFIDTYSPQCKLHIVHSFISSFVVEIVNLFLLRQTFFSGDEMNLLGEEVFFPD